MRRASVTVSVGLSVVFALVLSACDVDLFGNDRQPLVGPYGIFVGEGKFYLVLDRFDSGCGLLGDAIHRIGWNQDVILIEVEPCVGNGTPSDWRVVDVRTGKIETIDKSTIEARPDLARLQLMSADDAWSSGRSRRK